MIFQLKNNGSFNLIRPESGRLSIFWQVKLLCLNWLSVLAGPFISYASIFSYVLQGYHQMHKT